MATVKSGGAIAIVEHARWSCRHTIKAVPYLPRFMHYHDDQPLSR